MVELNEMEIYQYWAYRIVVTNANVAAKTIGLNITPQLGNRFIIDECITGEDDMAADRNVAVSKRDKDGNDFIIYVSSTSIDNEKITLPQQKSHATGTIPESVQGNPQDRMLFAGSDILRILVVAAVQNETITITLRGWLVGNALPVISKIQADQTHAVAYEDIY